MSAFLKKEWMELCRTGHLLMLLMIFTLFGIMNPALAKLTPWLMEAVSESLADTGLIVRSVTVDAMTSWTQFYKNMPVGIIVFILLCSGSFTAEYQKGTLITVITKGLSREKIVLAKALTAFAAWTASYWLCFGITYGYNAYFWDNSIAKHLFFAAAMTWLFGVWVLGLFVFFSAVSQSSTQVLLGVGAIVLGAYMLQMFPKLRGYLPVRLMDGMSLLQGTGRPEDYFAGITAAGITAFLCMAAAVMFFERKRL